MTARLAKITPGAEAFILYVARVSSDQENTDVGLIRYLVRMGHWSPFMHAYATMEIDTSRIISHHIIRHWTMACADEDDVPPGVQEFSQRYAEPTRTIKYRARMKGASNRQSSIDNASPSVQVMFQRFQQEVEEFCLNRYRLTLEQGVAPECARFLLPEATATRIYLSGTIRSWIHYLKERCGESTQLEHRQIALEARDALSKELPTVAEALGWTEAWGDDS